MEKVGCFAVGLGLVILALVVTTALVWLLGVPLYRLSNDRWPWESYYGCFGEVLMEGFTLAMLLIMFTILLYPVMSMLSDLGCWALKAGR